MRLRVALSAAAFALGASAISWAVWTDSRDARTAALLEEIESAEDRIPHSGVREMGGPAETVTLRIWADGGRRRVEFAGYRGGRSEARRPSPPKLPFFRSFPSFLRPGHGQWRRRVKDYGLTVRNYEVERTGGATVAGREADLYDVRPRHPGRPSYRIAADRENRFPLRFEVHNAAGTVFRTEFTEISYERPSGRLEAREAPPGPSWVKVDREELPSSRLSGRAGFPVWVPSRVPPGFELRGSEVLDVRADIPEAAREAARRLFPGAVPDVATKVAHLNYTDGLAVLSVVEVSADSGLWKLVRNWLPAAPAEAGGKVVARRFQDRFGAAYVMEVERTVVLVAGNVSPDVIEPMIRNFERR